MISSRASDAQEVTEGRVHPPFSPVDEDRDEDLIGQPREEVTAIPMDVKLVESDVDITDSDSEADHMVIKGRFFGEVKFEEGEDECHDIDIKIKEAEAYDSGHEFNDIVKAGFHQGDYLESEKDKEISSETSLMGAFDQDQQDLKNSYFQHDSTLQGLGSTPETIPRPAQDSRLKTTFSSGLQHRHLHTDPHLLQNNLLIPAPPALYTTWPQSSPWISQASCRQSDDPHSRHHESLRNYKLSQGNGSSTLSRFTSGLPPKPSNNSFNNCYLPCVPISMPTKIAYDSLISCQDDNFPSPTADQMPSDPKPSGSPLYRQLSAVQGNSHILPNVKNRFLTASTLMMNDDKRMDDEHKNKKMLLGPSRFAFMSNGQNDESLAQEEPESLFSNNGQAPSSSSVELKPPHRTKEKLYLCPFSPCEYKTSRRNNLKRHTITMHDRLKSPVTCCGRQLVRKADIKEHNNTYHLAGYFCPSPGCNKRFPRKALLDRHTTTHTGYKRFACDRCSYATSHRSNLERHVKVHAIDERKVVGPWSERKTGGLNPPWSGNIRDSTKSVGTPIVADSLMDNASMRLGLSLMSPAIFSVGPRGYPPLIGPSYQVHNQLVHDNLMNLPSPYISSVFSSLSGKQEHSSRVPANNPRPFELHNSLTKGLDENNYNSTLPYSDNKTENINDTHFNAGDEKPNTSKYPPSQDPLLDPEQIRKIGHDKSAKKSVSESLGNPRNESADNELLWTRLPKNKLHRTGKSSNMSYSISNILGL